MYSHFTDVKGHGQKTVRLMLENSIFQCLFSEVNVNTAYF